MVAGPALLGIVGLGAVGGILANIALTPLTAGASLLQSYWYGSGLILGERMMYTVHWEKIKGRLDKGEDFLQVLDKIMNDDITAIANLSFKAMDETGKLYLEKAGTGLAQFVEELLSAILLANPLGLGGGGTEPPPPGEDTPEGISHTVAQLEQMNLQQLTTIINNSSLYTASTVANARTIKAKKLLETEDIQEEKEDLVQFKFELFQTETAFLKELFTFINGTIQDVYTNFITKHSGPQQSLMMEHLTIMKIRHVFTKRRKTTESNKILNQMRDGLAIKRKQLIEGSTNQTAKQVQMDINARHVVIVLYQMIYSL